MSGYIQSQNHTDPYILFHVSFATLPFLFLVDKNKMKQAKCSKKGCSTLFLSSYIWTPPVNCFFSRLSLIDVSIPDLERPMRQRGKIWTRQNARDFSGTCLTFLVRPTK